MLMTLALVAPLMLSPGPANLASLAMGARHGLGRSVWFLLGITAGYAAVAAAIGGAGAALLDEHDTARRALQALGGLYIVYLGLRLARRDRAWNEPSTPPSLLGGLVLQLLNPKYPAVVLTVLATEAGTPAGARLASLVAAGAVGVGVYALAGATLRRLATDRRTQRRLDLVFGALLALTGAAILFRAAL